MKLIGVTNFTNKQHLNFRSGKIEVYSDFDKTYFPLKHSEMKQATPQTHPNFTKYCDDFSNFRKQTKDFLTLHLTTGRTFGETDTIYNLIKKQGFQLPLPDTLIVKNGGEEHLKIASDIDFYEKGIFPFKYDVTNKEKEKIIENITNWNGSKIKAKIIELLKKMDMKIVFADSENSEGDYGVRSLFGEGRLPYENGKVFHGTDKAQWVTGIRNDGNLKLFITFPPDMLDVEERKIAYQKFIENLNEFNKNVKIVGQFEQHTNKCQGRPYLTLEPQVELDKQGNLKQHHDGLTKVFDTKEAVKKAIINNDLVIVAGDSSNDFNMLNMYFYHDKLPKYEKGMKDNFIKRLNWDAYKNPSSINSFMDINNPTHAKIIKEIKELPIIGLVMLDENGECSLGDLVSAFGKKSPYNKIVVVPNGRLEDGIKYATKMYALQNKEFAKKLSPEILEKIAYIDTSKNIEAGKPLALLTEPGIIIENIKNGAPFYSPQYRMNPETEKILIALHMPIYDKKTGAIIYSNKFVTNEARQIIKQSSGYGSTLLPETFAEEFARAIIDCMSPMNLRLTKNPFPMQHLSPELQAVLYETWEGLVADTQGYIK